MSDLLEPRQTAVATEPHDQPMKPKAKGTVIDASLRFARTNPELVAYAYKNAAKLNASVDDLLLDAIDRVVASRSRTSRPRVVGRNRA